MAVPRRNGCRVRGCRVIIGRVLPRTLQGARPKTEVADLLVENTNENPFACLHFPHVKHLRCETLSRVQRRHSSVPFNNGASVILPRLFWKEESASGSTITSFDNTVLAWVAVLHKCHDDIVMGIFFVGNFRTDEFLHEQQLGVGWGRRAAREAGGDRGCWRDRTC